jgi:hypothetical protein
VLYTDGLVERRREPIDESLERLREAADGFTGDVEALCDHLMTVMAPPASSPHDDVAVIAMARER